MPATLNHARPRRQLADQLDRMDGILDALADALPAAVRDAVRDGLGAAAREAVAAALTDPAVLARLRAEGAPVVAFAPPTPPLPLPMTSPPPTRLARLGRWVGRHMMSVFDAAATVAAAGKTAIRRTWNGLAERYRAVRANVRAAAWLLDVVWSLRRAGAIALGVGLAVAGGSLASHTAAAVLAGTGAVATAAAVQAALKARRLLAGFPVRLLWAGHW